MGHPPVDPKTLHKYLYAGGDPVNAKDPTGRGVLNEYALIGAFEWQRVYPAIVTTAVATCTWMEVVDLLVSEYALGKSTLSGELPDRPWQLDILLDLAKQYCLTVIQK